MQHHRRLRNLWEDHDPDQKKVAACLNIDQRVYSTYETGKCEIATHHLSRPALLYRTIVDYLLELTNQREL